MGMLLLAHTNSALLQQSGICMGKQEHGEQGAWRATWKISSRCIVAGGVARVSAANVPLICGECVGRRSIHRFATDNPLLVVDTVRPPFPTEHVPTPIGRVGIELLLGLRSCGCLGPAFPQFGKRFTVHLAAIVFG